MGMNCGVAAALPRRPRTEHPHAPPSRDDGSAASTQRVTRRRLSIAPGALCPDVSSLLHSNAAIRSAALASARRSFARHLFTMRSTLRAHPAAPTTRVAGHASGWPPSRRRASPRRAAGLTPSRKDTPRAKMVRASVSRASICSGATRTSQSVPCRQQQASVEPSSALVFDVR